ncbi:MAG: hypothetical protein K8R90_03580 [Candidatus Cloacimonetes bacterium]|nr:hypothetical protein [Candidatus Cloacimonadota bacterium]
MRLGIMALVLFVLTSSLLFAQQNDSEVPQLDFEKINARYHTNRCNNDYEILSTFTSIELFELLFEFALDGSSHVGESMKSVTNHILGIPDKQNYEIAIIEWIGKENYPPVFRRILIDLAEEWIKIENPNYARFQEVLIKVAFENATDLYLRRSAVSSMDVEDSASQQVLSDLYDQTDDQALKRHILWKMRFARSPALEDRLAPILANPHEYDEKFLKSAIQFTRPDFDFLDELVAIAQDTESESIFCETMRALGRMNTPEAVIAFINSWGRLGHSDTPAPVMRSDPARKPVSGRKPVRSRLPYTRLILAGDLMLRPFHTAVEEMLTPEQSDEFIIYGLKAVRIGGLRIEMDVIEKIKSEAGNPEVQDECDLTLEFLLNNQENRNEDRERSVTGIFGDRKEPPKFVCVHLSDSYMSELDFEKIDARYHTTRYKQDIAVLWAMTAVELFELAYELVIDHPDRGRNGAMDIHPYVTTVLFEKNYSKALIQWIGDETYHPKFRLYLLDMAGFWINSECANYARYQEVLLKVAFEKESEVYLRSYVLNFIDWEDYASPQVLSDLYDQTEEPSLKRQVLSRMRMVESPALEEKISTILTNPSDYDEAFLKCAMDSMLPDFDDNYIDELVIIARDTESVNIYHVVLSSLNRMNTPEAIIALINSLGRFGYNTTPGYIPWTTSSYSSIWRRHLPELLWHSQITVERMLTLGQSDEFLIYGLRAVRIGYLHIEMGVIEKIKSETDNAEIRAECDMTLEYLIENQKKHNKDTMRKGQLNWTKRHEDNKR